MHGSGLRWFISFLVQIFYVEIIPSLCSCWLPSPLTPHSRRSTHHRPAFEHPVSAASGCLHHAFAVHVCDSNFPQRIRVPERDPDSRRTTMINRPYVSTGTAGKLWEPLRASIGTTMGGIATIGQRTVLVEGISDQIILAMSLLILNDWASSHSILGSEYRALQRRDKPKKLVSAVRAQNTTMAIIVDTDEQGVKTERLARREGAPFVHAAPFTGRQVGAIEDVVGVDDIHSPDSRVLPTVPLVHSARCRHRECLNRQHDARRYLEDYFEQHLQ